MAGLEPGRLRAGQSVLVHGAAGAVGTTVTQLVGIDLGVGLERPRRLLASPPHGVHRAAAEVLADQELRRQYLAV